MPFRSNHWRSAAAATCLGILLGLTALAFLAASPASAAPPTSKDMTFFLHFVNATETSKTLPGAGSTWTYFDTTTEWNDTNVTFPANGSQQTYSWYLVPPLARSAEVSAFSLSLWAQFISGNPNAQTTVELYERNDTGAENLVESANFGSIPFSVSPSLKQLNWTLASPHAFSAGSSIKVNLKVNPGSGAMEFIFDTARADSRITFRTADAVAVASIDVLGASGASAPSLDPLAANRTAHLRATLTDPYGGYDVARANLTILSPSGAVLLDHASMERIAGTALSLETVFDYAWNYSGQPPGEYQAFVTTMDNNGMNWFDHFAQFSFGPYGDSLSRSFFIGTLPLFAWVKVVDDRDLPLAQAQVTLYTGGSPVGTGSTDAGGLVNLTLFAGNYTLAVVWGSVQVASQPFDLGDNVTEASPALVKALVFYPTLAVVDSHGAPVEHAFVYVVYPNGSATVIPFRTDAAGTVPLERVAVGSLGVRVLWRGVEVASSSVSVTSSGTTTLTASVFYLSVTVNDGSGAPLAQAAVRIDDAAFGLLSAFNTTGANGSFVERLPTGTYDLEVRWRGVSVGNATGVLLNADRSQTLAARVFTLTARTLAKDGTPIAGATVTLTAASGEVFELKSSDAGGNATFQAPSGVYSLSAHFATTAYWSPIDDTQSAANITLDQARTVELRFQQVPGSFVGSNMFLATLVILALLVLIGLLARRRGGQETAKPHGDAFSAQSERKPGETETDFPRKG